MVPLVRPEMVQLVAGGTTVHEPPGSTGGSTVARYPVGVPPDVVGSIVTTSWELPGSTNGFPGAVVTPVVRCTGALTGEVP